MKLADYLKLKGISYGQFALKRGGGKKWHRMTIYAWAKGLRYPGPENLREIYRITKGAVTPNDFADIKRKK